MTSKLTNVQRAFLAGVRHGRQLTRRQVRHDVEDLIDETYEIDAPARGHARRANEDETGTNE